MSIEDKVFSVIHSGDSKTLKKLLAASKNAVHKPWPGGGDASFLHLSAGLGHLEICKILVDAGIEVNRLSSPHNVTALHQASLNGHRDLVDWLLESGALVDGEIHSTSTPLMLASMNGHLEVVKNLLKKKAEINRESLYYPQTALDFAEIYRVKKTGQGEVAEFLRAKGGLRPYLEAHDWSNHPEEKLILQVQKNMETFVSPVPLKKGSSKSPSVYRLRLPKNFQTQILFTVSKEDQGRLLCLPSRWPLCSRALKSSIYSSPLELLSKAKFDPEEYQLLPCPEFLGKNPMKEFQIFAPISKKAKKKWKWEDFALPLPVE